LSEPQPLPANSLPERIDMRNALRVEAAFEENAASKTWAMVAGKTVDQFGPPLFSVKRGRAAVMAFPNRDNFGHAIHLHGHHVRLLDNLDDGWKPFWLDTVMVGARQTARIAFVADNPGKWMLYAQRLEHPEIGMTAWFEVT
ncbi:MAG: multicopper oxidase domain-containing protein, partial [Pseudorhodoplanes sp.]